MLASTAGNTLRLLFSVRSEGRVEGVVPVRAPAALEELAPGSVAAWRASAVARGTFPFWIVDLWLAVTTAAAALVLVSRTIARSRRSGPDAEAERRRGLLFLVLVAPVADAALCGIVSRPLSRYQMRILWLLPLSALLFGGCVAGTLSVFCGHRP
ncbi:MAG: hypothetical protein NZP72_13345 [Geminicoccaceae bacterium]|nr:hypothetical protein [Geminicoccaceae bacterium]MCS7267881.1 hypothetical protein [Geminicoccaceae bacterium]